MTSQTTNFDSKLKHADPIIAGILNNALSEKEIDIKDSVILFSAKGIELEPVSYTHLTLPTILLV